MFVCVFPACAGHDDRLDALLHGQQATHEHLTRLERLVRTLTLETEHAMSELDDRIADIMAAEDTNTAAIARLIADFESKGALNDDQRAALDAVKQHLVDNSAAIDAADAPPPPVDTPTV